MLASRTWSPRTFDGARNGIQFFSPEGEYAELAPFDPTRGAPAGVGAWLSDGSIITDREFVVSGTAETMSVSSAVGGTGDEAGRPIARYRPDGTRELLYTAWEPPPPTGDGAEAGGGSFSFNLWRNAGFSVEVTRAGIAASTDERRHGSILFVQARVISTSRMLT